VPPHKRRRASGQAIRGELPVVQLRVTLLVFQEDCTSIERHGIRQFHLPRCDVLGETSAQPGVMLLSECRTSFATIRKQAEAAVAETASTPPVEPVGPALSGARMIIIGRSHQILGTSRWRTFCSPLPRREQRVRSMPAL
jgi:hypothetical protein